MSLKEKSELNARERILDAAEHIFAMRGVDGASMRAITAQAKVNLSVAYYYFKDKEALLFAVFERHVKPLMDRQVELLEKAGEEAGSLPISPRRLVEAMILPRAECKSETVHRLFTMLLLRRGAFEQRIFESLEASTSVMREKFLVEFQKTFPKLSRAELNFRIESVHTMLAGWTAIAPFKKEMDAEHMTREVFLAMFTAVVLEMFNAPPTLPKE